MTIEREQKLVDLVFAVAMRVREMGHLSRDEVAEWVTDQLTGCGFPTQVMGSSWGMLIATDEDGQSLEMHRAIAEFVRAWRKADRR